MSNEIKDIEMQIYELNEKLTALRKSNPTTKVPNYTFNTVEGEITLLELFGENDKLLMIHNMGQGCRYCMLWADGFNGFLPHLESAMSVALVSKDAPELQRRFANERGWRFRLASHGGGEYIREQTVTEGEANSPGAVVYERIGDEIFRKNSSEFGPGDIYCSMWGLLGLAGMGENEWTPQYNYWKRPLKLDDGGLNVL
ncbi:MAG: DUF899 family protein [FCB group bacterium]|nr:DUF899 family protein [FCB group bacterium]MBL7028704.1 DUF899 family protein [Candidatus Neomarinimicrobiota bacterium]MBL7120692.1 DUF899 family protein [Candidatus Neomarinimicrobiota bacterium]